jgi:regulator of protease activity HflC (stomatin/prohibitin superfamily)
MGKKAEKEAELERQAAKKAEKEAKKAAAKARKEARKDAKAAADGSDDENAVNFIESNVNNWTDEEQAKLNEALAKVPSSLDKKERWKAISEIVETRSMKVTCFLN